MNESWVGAHLELLTSKIRDCKAVLRHIEFEPTDAFYTRLAEGEEDDLQLAVAEIAHFLDLQAAPPVHYDWGIKMEPEVAGRINYKQLYHSDTFRLCGQELRFGGHNSP